MMVEVVVRGTAAGPASVGELTRGKALVGIVIWKLCGVGAVSGTGVPALLLALSGLGVTAEKVGVLMEERREVEVRGTVGLASVGKGESTRGEAPVGNVIWKLCEVGGVLGTGIPRLRSDH